MFQPFAINFEGSDDSVYIPEYRYDELHKELDWTAYDVQLVESLFIECAFLGVVCFESTGNSEEDALKIDEIESNKEDICIGNRCVPTVDYAFPIESKYWSYIENMYGLFDFYSHNIGYYFDPEDTFSFYPLQGYYDSLNGISFDYPEHWGDRINLHMGISVLFQDDNLGYVYFESEDLTTSDENYLSQQFLNEPELLVLDSGYTLYFNITEDEENEEKLKGGFIIIDQGIAVIFSLNILNTNHEDFDILIEELYNTINTVFIE